MILVFGDAAEVWFDLVYSATEYSSCTLEQTYVLYMSHLCIVPGVRLHCLCIFSPITKLYVHNIEYSVPFLHMKFLVRLLIRMLLDN